MWDEKCNLENDKEDLIRSVDLYNMGKLSKEILEFDLSLLEKFVKGYEKEKGERNLEDVKKLIEEAKKVI